MSCRIGITTNPDTRRAQWEKDLGRKVRFTILQTCATQSEAQQAETALAALNGCISSPGGQPANGPWYVYRIDY